MTEYAIFLLDPRGLVTTWNAGAERLNGYRADEIIGQHVSRFYGADDLELGKPQHELEVAARDGSSEDEGWRVRKNGSRLWASVVISALRDVSGTVVGFGKVMRDMTDGVRGKELFRLALEAIPTGILMIDSRGRIVLVNAPVEALFGYTRAELLGQSIEMIVPDRFRGQHRQQRAAFLDDARTRGMGAGRDLYGLRKDGREIPIDIGLNPFQTPEGNFVLSSIVDLTEHKRSMDHLRLAIEASPTGILMVDDHGTIALVNAQVEKLFGYPRAALVGQPVEILVPERFRSRHPEFRTGFFRNPQFRAMGGGRDLYGLHRDGSEVPVEIGLNPHHTEAGDFVISSIVDITERKRTMEALSESEERLRMAQHASGIGAFEWNLETGVNTWTPEMEAMYGLPAGGFDRTRRSWESLVHPEDRGGEFERMDRAIESGASTRTAMYASPSNGKPT